MSDVRRDAVDGAQNLLRNCVQLSEGETLLLVTEDDHIDYFDVDAAEIIAEQARDMNATVLTMSTGTIAGPDSAPAALSAAMMHVDHTVFMNRIGDQLRFRALPGDGTKTMVYTLDVDTLGSLAAGFHHDFTTRMARLFNETLDSTRSYRVTCANGTDVSGDMPEPAPATDVDGGFTVRMFPMSVYKPIPADTMNGQIVLQRWVTGTNTHAYSPEVHHLRSPLTVHIENGHAADVEGEQSDVDAFLAHGAMVAEKFGLDQSLIHSWHSGINPGTSYFAQAKDNPVRWNGMMFGSPRYLHFHTCGDYPPGEISWHVLDPTVTFDGNALIEAGEVSFFHSEPAKALLAEFDLTVDDMRTRQDIGL